MFRQEFVDTTGSLVQVDCESCEYCLRRRRRGRGKREADQESVENIVTTQVNCDVFFLKRNVMLRSFIYVFKIISEPSKPARNTSLLCIFVS